MQVVGTAVEEPCGWGLYKPVVVKSPRDVVEVQGGPQFVGADTAEWLPRS